MAYIILLFLFFFQAEQINSREVKQTYADSISQRDSGAVLVPQTVNQINDSTLDSIAKSTKKTSENTEPTPLSQTDNDEIWNLILAGIAAIGTLLTAFMIYRESRQQQINKKFQFLILQDLIRHLYRNKIIIRAMTLKLSEQGFREYFPSEEHLLKLKVLPEDLRISRFNTTTKHYDILHEFELKFRNFNTEVDVALDHLKQKYLGTEIKERDLDVLEFKSGFLTKEIMNLMDDLDFEFNDKDLTDYINQISDRFLISKINWKVPQDIYSPIIYVNKYKYLNDIFYRPNLNRRFYEEKGLEQFLERDTKIEKAIINLIPYF